MFGLKSLKSVYLLKINKHMDAAALAKYCVVTVHTAISNPAEYTPIPPRLNFNKYFFLFIYLFAQNIKIKCIKT